MSRPYSIKDALHRDPALSILIEKEGSEYYMAMKQIRASTPTIVNQAISDASWTAIATSLTEILEWRLAERTGNDFYYAYTAAPAAYVTAFGWVSYQTAVTDIYVKRKGASGTINIQLEYWKK